MQQMNAFHPVVASYLHFFQSSSCDDAVDCIEYLLQCRHSGLHPLSTAQEQHLVMTHLNIALVRPMELRHSFRFAIHQLAFARGLECCQSRCRSYEALQVPGQEQ